MEWYIDSTRTKVDLSTVRDAQGVATKDVWRLVQRDDGSLMQTRWATAGRSLRLYDVQQAQRVASTADVPAERVPPPSPTPTGASSAALIDTLGLRRLDAKGVAAMRRAAGQAAIDYADATVTTQPWDALPTAVPGNQQVSGNRLFYAASGAVTSTNPIAYTPLPANVPLTSKFRLVGGFVVVTGGATVFLGISTTDRAATTVNASVPDDLAIGLTTSGLTRVLHGSNVGGPGAGAPIDQTPFAVTPGVYQVIFEGDGTEVSVSIRHATDHTKTFTFRVPVATLGAAKSIGRILTYNADTRGTAGYALTPFIMSAGSRQPSRTKVVGNQTIEGLAHRDLRRLTTRSGGTDTWRASIPAGYDPRKPAPLAVYLHPAQSSVGTTDRPWSLAQEQPLSKALNDAGYIVATSQDGTVQGQPNTDRFANDVSLAEQLALITYMRQQFAISEVVLYGPSMGCFTGLNLLMHRDVPNIAAAYFIDGGCDLGLIWNSTDPAHAGFKAPLANAYGIAADGSDYAAKTAGHDPAQREGWEFRGVPLRLVSGQTDTTAPASMHTAFLDKVKPFAPEASQIVAAGGHVDPTHYSASDLMAFLNRHVA